MKNQQKIFTDSIMAN